MANMFFNKVKEYMNEGIKVMKDETLHQLSKKVDWIDSPYQNKQDDKTILQKNIELSNISNTIDTRDYSLFEDRRLK